MTASTRPRLEGRRPAGVVGVVRRHPVATHLGLTFALSWGYWLALMADGGQGSHVPGLLGPAAAAVVVTAVVEGRAGLADLGARVLRWRVPVGWYLVAVAPALVGLAAAGLLALMAPTQVDLAGLTVFPGLPDVGWFGMVALVLVCNGFGEEIGWRGFVWPRLRRTRRLGAAAGLLALPWAAWHLPTFWLRTGLEPDPWVLPGWLVGLAAGAVVLGWLLERTGSLLLAALFHTSINLVGGTDVGAIPVAVSSAGIILVAVLLLRHDARARGQEPPAR